MAEPGQHVYWEEDYSLEAQSTNIYYRIKEVDRTNQEYYSSIARLSSKGNHAVSVYPNPAKNIITISGHAMNGQLAVQVFDAAGRLAIEENWQQPAGNYSKTIHVENLMAGVYWLQINGIQSNNRVKIVKE